MPFSDNRTSRFNNEEAEPYRPSKASHVGDRLSSWQFNRGRVATLLGAAGAVAALLAVLVPVVVRAASRHRARRRTPAVLPSPWRPSDPGGSAPRESDAA